MYEIATKHQLCLQDPEDKEFALSLVIAFYVLF